MNNLGLNMAATIAADSFNVGGNWGFLSENNRDFDKICFLEMIKRIV